MGSIEMQARDQAEIETISHGRATVVVIQAEECEGVAAVSEDDSLKRFIFGRQAEHRATYI